MDGNILLPEEILIEIFDHLSHKMVKTCAIVCKRWDEIISNSMQLMKKFQLNLEESEQNIKKASELKRNHQVIKLKNLNENSLNVISLHNLWHLQLSCCKIESLKLANVLRNLPMLEIFHAKGVDLIDDAEDVKIPLQLKELKIEYCNIDIVGFFDTNTLKIFEVSSLLEEQCDNVISLLKYQENLKEFSVGGVICEDFFESPEIFNFNFHLTSLKIDKASMVSHQNEALFKFLLLHEKTLKSLKILYPIQNHVNKFILTNLPDLHHLEIPITTFSENGPSYLVELPASKIESIVFFGIFRNLNNAKSILDLLKNVKFLDLSQITTSIWFMEFLLHISKNLKNLESLKIPNLFNQKCHQNIFFPKLKCFSVAKIYDESIYSPFIRRHSSTLEEIFIGWTDDNFIKGLIIDEIMNCEKLHKVIICSYSPLVTRMFNKVSTKKTSWTLESRIKNNHLDSDFIPLKFKFPDDKAVWDDRCRIFSDELIREFSTVDNYGLNAFVNKYK